MDASKIHLTKNKGGRGGVGEHKVMRCKATVPEFEYTLCIQEED